MQEDIFPDRPTSKLYTENSIRVATFLGGPLVAGYLIADNYRQLGEIKKVQTTWLVTIPATILIFVIAFYLPEKTPPFLIPIGYTLITFYIAQNLQGAKIKAHVAAGGQTWSMGRAVLVGFAGLAIIAGFVFAAILLLDRPIG
ncbi:MAG TPA: hypothetical protein VK588_03425 [Chitinophagaceae bacterium]|nr:hypothetical protein [Chitinophagaceae bacterium]